MPEIRGFAVFFMLGIHAIEENFLFVIISEGCSGIDPPGFYGRHGRDGAFGFGHRWTCECRANRRCCGRAFAARACRANRRRRSFRFDRGSAYRWLTIACRNDDIFFRCAPACRCEYNKGKKENPTRSLHTLVAEKKRRVIYGILFRKVLSRPLRTECGRSEYGIPGCAEFRPKGRRSSNQPCLSFCRPNDR